MEYANILLWLKKHDLHNFLFGILAQRSLKSRALVIMLTILLIDPTQSFAVNLGQLKELQSFQAVVLSVAMIKRAIKDAVENPMDQKGN